MNKFINIYFADGTRMMVNMKYIHAASFLYDKKTETYTVSLFCAAGDFQDMLFSFKDGEILGKMLHNPGDSSQYMVLTDLSPAEKPSEE